VSGRDVALRLKSVLSAHGNLQQFCSYASIGINLTPQDKRSELQLTGYHLVDCLRIGRKEVADKMIIVDVMEFAFTHPQGATLCFITEDVDYTYLLTKLQKLQWRTIVISRGNLHPMLHVNCDTKLCWEIDILQMPQKILLSPPPGFSTLNGFHDDEIIVQDDKEEYFAGTTSFLGFDKNEVPTGLGIIQCDKSVQSLEVLTMTEGELDDTELLHSVILHQSHMENKTTGIRKLFVGSLLCQTNTVWFPNRTIVQDFLPNPLTLVL